MNINNEWTGGVNEKEWIGWIDRVEKKLFLTHSYPFAAEFDLDSTRLGAFGGILTRYRRTIKLAD